MNSVNRSAQKMEKPQSAGPNHSWPDNSARRSGSDDALLDIMVHLTTAVHTLIFAFLALILYICFANEWTFFTWHPLLMTIGVS